MSTPHFTRYDLASAAGGLWIGSAPDEVRGISTDTRKIAAGSLFVALAGERFDGHDFLAEAQSKGAAAAMVSDRWYRKDAASPSPGGPSTPPALSVADPSTTASAAAQPSAYAQGKRKAPSGLPLLVVRDTLDGLGALARFHRRRFQIPVIGVTGSNGKTTTREMIGEILATRSPTLKTEGNLNNEIGVPLTLFGLGPEHQQAVIEMGMNHAGEIARLTAIAEPRVGVVTLAGAAHLEMLGSVDGVADAKAELYFGLPADGICVANADDARMLQRAEASDRAVISFGVGRDSDADVVVVDVLEHGPNGLHFTLGIGQRLVEVHLPLVGLHNTANAAAAAAATIALGYSDHEIVAGLRNVKPVGRRLRVDALPSGVLLIDDCYNANPISMLAALATLHDLAQGGRRPVAVLGDMLELGPDETEAHRTLGEQVAAKGATALFAFGPRSRHTAEAARTAGLANVQHTEDMNDLIARVKAGLAASDVLLVKGSRGNKLERLVEALR